MAGGQLQAALMALAQEEGSDVHAGAAQHTRRRRGRGQRTGQPLPTTSLVREETSVAAKSAPNTGMHRLVKRLGGETARYLWLDRAKEGSTPDSSYQQNHEHFVFLPPSVSCGAPSLPSLAGSLLLSLLVVVPRLCLCGSSVSPVGLPNEIRRLGCSASLSEATRRATQTHTNNKQPNTSTAVGRKQHTETRRTDDDLELAAARPLASLALFSRLHSLHSSVELPRVRLHRHVRIHEPVQLVIHARSAEQSDPAGSRSVHTQQPHAWESAVQIRWPFHRPATAKGQAEARRMQAALKRGASQHRSNLWRAIPCTAAFAAAASTRCCLASSLLTPPAPAASLLAFSDHSSRQLHSVRPR